MSTTIASDPPTVRRIPLADAGWFEVGSAFAILLPLLFVPQLAAVGVAASFTAAAVYAWVRRRDAAVAFARRWPLLLIPAYALASTLWSDFPGVTLKHALEFTVTASIAILLSSSRRPAHLLLGAGLAFGLFLAVSLVFGHSVTVTNAVLASDMGTSFTGLNGGKNYLGMTAALGVMISFFALFWSLQRRWLLAAGAAIATIALEALLTYLSHSAGATIALAVGLVAFVVAASLGRVRRSRRPAVCVVLLAGLAAGGAFGYAFANSVTAQVLNIFHKDPTLTGRSYLWYRAADFIHEKPLLGHGYEAFWVQGNLDAEGLWQYGGVTDRMGFNFHNTPIELLIHFGWIGAILTAGVFVWASLKLLGRTVAQPTLAGAFYVAFLAFQITRMPFESELPPSAVDFGTLITIMALGLAFQPLEARPEPARSGIVTPYRGRPAFARAGARRSTSGK